MESQKNSSTAEDFRMKYEILIDDIKYIKSRQWTVTYYLLALYGAIVGFYGIIKSDNGNANCILKIFLFIISVAIAGYGTVYQCDFQKRLAEYRMLLDKLLSYLSPEFKEFEKRELNKRYNGVGGYLSWWNGFWLFTFPFILMLWVGVLFIGLYFLRGN